MSKGVDKLLEGNRNSAEKHRMAYAKETAIGFAEFMDNNGYTKTLDGLWKSLNDEHGEIIDDLYFQVISQMYWADVLRGRAIFFHPDFPTDSPYRLGEVIFKKVDLMPDFNLFKQRMGEAALIFDTILNFKKAAI